MARYSHIDMDGKVKSLRANLDERYKEFFCIIQELLQNADDAGATAIFIGQLENLSDKHELCRVPGIFIINNGPVSISDLDHIFSIASSNKDDDDEKIGKFGLGMKSVFHLCESFFVFGHQSSNTSENVISEFFDPWDNEKNLAAMPDPHPQWRQTFNESSHALWEDVSKKLQEFHDFGKDWFALWLPLRQRDQCNGGKGALLDYFPLEENAKEWFTVKDFRKVSGMMPFFKHLKNIHFVAGALEKYGSLELIPEKGSSFTGNSRNEWSGVISSDKNILGKQVYHGWEFYGHKDLEELRQTVQWPTAQRWDDSKREWCDQKDKTSPHAAICYCAEETDQNTGNLTLQECVFLPLSEMQQSLPLQCPYNITVSFHGQYFVDAGRRRYKLEDDKSVDDIKVRWNKMLRSELLLPKVLQTFTNFFGAWKINDIKSVLQSFTISNFWKDSQEDICKKSQFLLCLTKNGWVWKREDASQNFILLPDVDRPQLLQAIFQKVNKNNIIVQYNSPWLSTNQPSEWPADQISRLWEASAMLDEKNRYDSVTLDFLEKSLKMIDNPENQLPGIQKYLCDINMSQYRQIKDQLGRILYKYPHCRIAFAKDNWTTVSFELWKRILCLATDCLPLDLSPDENISFRYSERDLQSILPELEKELAGECDSNCRAVIRDLVCSIFRSHCIDWKSSVFAKYKLFVVQDKKLSFSNLQAMHSDSRLFRQGGDIQAIAAIQKAVKWDFETLPFYYSDALKGTLDVIAFTKDKHIPEIFRSRPSLSAPADRIDLLKRLKSENDIDTYFKVVRYLLHGQKDQYEYAEDIEIPSISSGEQELFNIGIKLLSEINVEKPQWDIPSELIALFSEVEMDYYGIRKLRFEEIFRKIKDLSLEEQEKICGVWRTPSSWKYLANYLNSAEDLQILADLPIWHCKNNKYIRLDNNCFLENDISIPDCVSHLINQLDIYDYGQIELVTGKLPQCRVWDDCSTVMYCTQLPWSKECTEEIWEAVENYEGVWNSSYLEKLFTYPLFETLSGRWISFMQITPTFAVQSAEIYSTALLTEKSRTNYEKLAAQGSPEKNSWTKALIPAFCANEDFVWGDLPENLCSTDKFKELFADRSLMPILRFIDDMADRIDADELLRCTKGNVKPERLEAICTYISNRYEQNNKPLFMEFLQAFIIQAQKSTVSWLNVSLPNVTGQSCPCASLVRQADGVDQQYVLHPDLKKFFIGSKTVTNVANVLPQFSDSANLSSQTYRKLISQTGNILHDYFSNWPEELHPAIGAFLLLIGNNQKVSRIAKEFIDRDQKLVWEKISEEFAKEIEKYNLIIKVFEGDSLEMISLAGTKLSIPLQDNSKLDSLLIGEDYYNCRLDGYPELFVFLAFRRVIPETLNKEFGMNLLINTAKKLVARFDAPTEKVPELFGEMKSVEQFDLQTTRSLLLKELPTILRQMNLPRDNELKALLREWNDNNKYKTQAELEGKTDLSEYDQRFQDLLTELQDLFEKYEQVREETLSAIRRRISTAEYGYEISSVPFELFQNADDAALEWQVMQGIPENEKNVRQSFVIELTDDALNIIHWGRPINQYQYAGFDHEKGEKLGFGDDLQKMLLLGVSDKSDDEIIRTGKFGLGFKSIFLVTDNPLIISNRLAFSIQGGLLPKPADSDEKNILHEIVARHNKNNGKVTVFHLPLRKDVKFDLEKFKSAAGLLVRFARKINEIRIIDHSEEITFCSADDNYYEIWNLGNVQLAMGKCDNLPAPLSTPPATIWVTSPTQITKNFSFAVNGNFNIDVGRNQLLCAPENAELARKGAEHLFEFLTSKAEEYTPSHWKNLWDIISNGESSGTWNILSTDKATSQVLKELFWGTREAPAGYGKFLQHHNALPTGLPSVYEDLTAIDRIKYAADEKLSEYWRIFEGFVRQRCISPGEIIGRKTAGALEHIYSNNYLPTLSLSSLLRQCTEENPELSPDMINSKNWKNFIDLCGSLYQGHCEKFLFLNRKKKYCPAANLLIPGVNNDEESLRAAFAPDEALLSDKYDRDALVFFRYARKKVGISAEVLAQWAISAKTTEKRNAVFYYLAEGELQEQVAEYIRCKLLPGNWLEKAYKNRPDEKGLKKLFLHELKSEDEWKRTYVIQHPENFEPASQSAENEEDLDISPVAPGSATAVQAQDAPESFWQEAYNSWQLVNNDIIRTYNRTVYGTDVLEPFPLELQSQQDRDRWIALFTLGAAHALGRTKLEQHSGFINWCKSKGYWNTFTTPEIVAAEWIQVIDQHIETNDSEYGYWFRLYPAIYLFAKYLDQYVEMFSQWKDEDSISGWRDLAEFKNNYTYNGTDFSMPDLKLGLGNIGMHFVFRELYRSNTLRVPGMERYCFVHSESNRQYFEGKVNSENMYDCLRKYLDDPTFDGQFDVAFKVFGE